MDVDIGEEADLVEDLVFDRLVAAQDDDVRLDADAAQLLTECWVGFVFSSPVAPMGGSQVTWT